MKFKLALRNLIHYPLSTILSWILLLFGVAIISLLITLQYQITTKFDADLNDIDLVVGAKGSPLQLVLSAIYHADAPPGNIKESEALKIMNDPFVGLAIPLAYGDSYKGFSIIGTDSNYLKKYNATFAIGSIFNKSMEAILGSNVAASSKLQIGSSFFGNHGLSENGHLHKENIYKVKGILNTSGTGLDNLVITNIATVREIHEHHHSEADHVHENKVEKSHEKEGIEPELTAILLKFKTPMAMLTIPRIVNETTNMQAVNPNLEINRLIGLLGIGITSMQFIALGIIVMAGLSIFIALYSRMQQREYEMAMLRVFGYSRWELVFTMLFEGLLLTFIGFTSGWLLSRVGIFLLNTYSNNDYHLNFNPWVFIKYDFILLFSCLLVGILASILPAIRIFKINISTILSHA